MLPQRWEERGHLLRGGREHDKQNSSRTKHNQKIPHVVAVMYRRILILT